MQQQDHSNGRRERRRDRRGVAMVTVLVALVALIAAASLAIDVGLVWAARTQLQAATDAAALAGAANLIDKTGPAVTLSEAIAATQDQAGLHLDRGPEGTAGAEDGRPVEPAPADGE